MIGCFVILNVVPWAAGQEAPTPSIQIANRASGLKYYETGQWGVVCNLVDNPRSSEAQLLLAVGFQHEGKMEFCNRLWLPPQSRRLIYTPLFATDADKQARTLGVESRLIEMIDGRERAAPPRRGTLLKHEAGFNSAILADSEADEAGELLMLLRQSASLNTTSATLSPADAPPMAAAYGALNALLIARHTLDLDPLRLDALRQWLLNGGRVWIMLDRSDLKWPAALLGEDWDVAVVDQVELTDFTLDGVNLQRAQHLDYPVKFLRILAPGFTVTHRINGYPAAMQKQIGQGQLLITTLEARGWLDEQHGITDALQGLDWFVRRDTERSRGTVDPQQAIKGYVREQIAYQILGRTPVLSVLTALAMVILSMGFWLSRSGKLEYLGAISAGGAVMASLVLVWTGMAKQSSTPTTLASTQLVQVSARQPYEQISGLASIYTAPADSSRAGIIELNQGGVAMPDLAAQGTGLLRMVWTDPDHVRFENLQMPSGAAISMRVNNTIAQPAAPRVLIRFDEKGVTGQLPWDDASSTLDPLIATPTGNMAIRMDNGQRFTAGEQDILEPGQFIASAMLNQEQMARQEVYRQLLSGTSFPDQPSLLVWRRTDSLQGVSYTVETVNRHESLWVIPLRYEKPTSGRRVTIPAPLLAMSSYRGEVADETSPAHIYNADTRQWVADLHEPTLVLMRFEVPPALLPLDIESAKLTLDLRAPGRGYEIVTLDAGQLHRSHAGDNPLGRVVVELKGDEAPRLQSDGSVIVGIQVGAFSNTSKSRGWTIEQMSLSVSGVAP
ncbi:MAG: hypothetical protein IT445_10680 [Phycisphaeraceae bacterium]|nr:hypothetical protein [Phycisphaeraceae bacterium]